jgi:diguanylate cyclase (GGDEF)-like protein
MAKAVIICIDDDRMVLTGLRDQLNRILKHRYDIELAESGEEALEIFKDIYSVNNEVPLVICDQILSGMSGEEVLISIHSQYPQTRTILLTGQPNLKGVLKAVNQASLYRYIAKPWEETDLGLTIKEALRSYHSDRKLKRQNLNLKRINSLLQEEIAKRQGIETQLRYENFHDHLTGLANRSLLLRTLHQAIDKTQNLDNYLFALLFVDLERFKSINDTLGHTVGDLLLIAVARRLEQVVRLTDTIARVGGDEFVILVEPIKNPEDATLVAQRIGEEFKLPFQLEGQEVFAFPTIGITFSNQQYQQASQVLRDADIAMYFSRQKRTNAYEIFQPSMHSKTIERLNIERDLNRALKNQEFRVYYQPIISVASSEIVGFEALVRWHHPTKGLVSPAEFIPIAERSGLIVDIGEWVLKTACQQMKTWSLEFPDNKLKISVNISLKQLKDPELIAKIDCILTETDWQGYKLQLEITESMLMDDVDRLIETFAQLASRNIQLSIDDFGTGYSSLSYLHRFPVNYLKVDRSFIKNISKHLESKKITELIIMLAHNLDMEVVAEGVETTEQLECLRPFNCEYVQGYLFSPPVPAEAATKLLCQSG